MIVNPIRGFVDWAQGIVYVSGAAAVVITQRRWLVQHIRGWHALLAGSLCALVFLVFDDRQIIVSTLLVTLGVAGTIEFPRIIRRSIDEAIEEMTRAVAERLRAQGCDSCPLNGSEP